MTAAIVLGGLGACASPPAGLLSYELDVPMQVLSVPGAPGVMDGRGDFRRLFCEELAADPEFAGEPCDSYLHRLADEPPAAGLAPVDRPLDIRLVVVPGLFSECAPGLAMPFAASIQRLAARGVRVDFLQVSGRSGSDSNARQIANYLGTVDPRSGQQLVLVGHSKGAVDLLHFLVGYPGLARRVDAMLSVAGAINGSPRADDARAMYGDWLADIDLVSCDAGDGLAMEHLTRRYRMNWLASNPLPSSVAYYSLVAFAGPDRVGLNSQRGHRALSVIDPRNDGQLLFYDQVIPGSTLLGTVNANHWAVALPVTEISPLLASLVVTKNRFPRDAMLIAALRMIADRTPRGVRSPESAPAGPSR